MKKLTLGIATAAMLLTAAPAMAQFGFYAGPGGVGVAAPAPYYGYACGPYNYPCNGYYDYYGGPRRGDRRRRLAWRPALPRRWPSPLVQPRIARKGLSIGGPFLV
jgi:hypothetical protein